MKKVLETTKTVIEKSQHVRIDDDALHRFSEKLLTRAVEIPPWNCSYHYCGNEEQTVSYLLVLDTLNFCFWALPGEKRWESVIASEKLSGYFGLAAALKQALESHIPITEAEFLCNITQEGLKSVLGGSGTLPLFDKRVRLLNELGQVLMSAYSGRPVHLVEEACNSAVTLACLLAENVASFRDVASYKGREVFFLKRAQIFAADLHSALGGRSWGAFHDINKLTAFADYKLPQVLRHLRILRFSQDLAHKVDNKESLEVGSGEEVEIRANTVWAVESIRKVLEQKGKKLTAPQIDWILWNLGQDDQYRAKPYHRTLTIFY